MNNPLLYDIFEDLDALINEIREGLVDFEFSSDVDPVDIRYLKDLIEFYQFVLKDLL